MKKILFSIATIVATNFAFGQITLEHSFPNDEHIDVFSNNTDLIYIGNINNNSFNIYNSDYTLRKTVSISLPANYTASLLHINYVVSQHIFNTDDKYEFLISASGPFPHFKLIIINEDSQIIKDFHPNPDVKGSYYGNETYEIFHDNIENKNKIKVLNMLYENGTQTAQYDIYTLPTSELTTKEIKALNKLSAFPIPTNKILNVINPHNGVKKIEVYDTSGKLVINKNFTSSENKISVDVENLPKGIYVYKIGDLSSKFIKN